MASSGDRPRARRRPWTTPGTTEDMKKPHHWSKLCIAAFLKSKGYDDDLIEAFEERAVDGYMLFGRGKESVASLASLEAWGADDPGDVADGLD